VSTEVKLDLSTPSLLRVAASIACAFVSAPTAWFLALAFHLVYEDLLLGLLAMYCGPFLIPGTGFLGGAIGSALGRLVFGPGLAQTIGSIVGGFIFGALLGLLLAQLGTPFAG
jgi:hypothetical protein